MNFILASSVFAVLLGVAAGAPPIIRLPPPPGVTGGSFGDPHILTWGNEYFDFMGECDLVLAETETFGDGLGFVAHVRTKTRYDYSYIESAAVKIGDDVLEVGGYGSYILNGISNADMPATMGEDMYTVTYTNKGEHDHSFDIQIGETDHVIVGAFKDLVFVRFSGVHETDFADARGLMGDFKTGKHLSRDGLHVIENDNIFGQEWQVNPDVDPQLFWVQSDVQYPAQKCVMPTPVADGRRLVETTISVKDATKACSQHLSTKGAIQACVHDAIAFGDLEAGQAGAF